MNRVTSQRRWAIAVAIAVPFGACAPGLVRLAADHGVTVGYDGAVTLAAIAMVGCVIGGFVGLKGALRQVREDRREIGLDA